MNNKYVEELKKIFDNNKNEVKKEIYEVHRKIYNYKKFRHRIRYGQGYISIIN